MSAALALLLLPAISPSADIVDLYATPRVPIVVWVNGAESPQLRPADVINSLNQRLLRIATLEAVRAPELEAGCVPEDIACQLHAVATADNASTVIHALVLGAEQSGQGLSLSGVYVQGSRQHWLALAAVEEDLLSNALILPARSAGNLDKWAEEVIREHIQPALPASGLRSALASIIINHREPITVELDARTIGTSVGMQTRVHNALPGAHRLRLRAEATRALLLDKELELEASEVHQVVLPGAPRSSAGPSVSNGLVYGAGTAVAAGAIAMGLAIAAGGSRETVCLDSNCGSAERSFAAFCDFGSGQECRGASSIRLLPLGLATFATAGFLTIGAFEHDRLHPVWWALLGAAAGVVTYGALVLTE